MRRRPETELSPSGASNLAVGMNLRLGIERSYIAVWKLHQLFGDYQAVNLEHTYMPPEFFIRFASCQIVSSEYIQLNCFNNNNHIYLGT